MDLSRKFAVCLFWGIAGLVPQNVAAKKVWIDGVLLRVNDQILTLSQFEKRLAQARKQMEPPPSGEDKTFRDTLLNDTLEEMLVLVRAKELDYAVSKSDLDRALDTLRERNKLPEVEMVYQMAGQMGMSKDELLDQMRHQILMERVMQSEVFPQRDITDWELQEYYKKISKDFMVPERYHLKVLALLNPATQATKTGEIRKALAASVPFDTLVEQYSELEPKSNGGDIGLVSPSDLTSPARDVLQGLKPGEISPPIEMRGGWYFAQLIEIIPAHPRPYTEVKDQVLDRMNKDKYKDKIREYIENLKKRYHVVTNPQLLEEPN